MGAFLDMLLMIVCSKATLIIFLIIYAGAVIADIFRRHLLSNGFVYYFTVLMSPFAAAVSFYSFMLSFADEDGFWTLAFTFLGSSLLTVLAATVYIRGHIKPVDTASGKLAYANSEQIKMAAAIRLIITGTVGTAIFGIIFIWSLIFAAEYIFILTPIMIVLFVFLFVPGANVFACFLFLIFGAFYGAAIAEVGASCMAAMLMSLLVTNGCIRYILTTDKTKGQKTLLIFLSFIPIYNVVYGIYNLIDNKKE